VEVGDWDALSDEDRRRVADPAGEGVLADDAGSLKRQLGEWRANFQRHLEACPPKVLDYVTAVVSALRDGGIRISPRRARLLSRSLLAATIVEGQISDALFLSILRCSLPHQAWGETLEEEKVRAAHRLAWDSAMLEGVEKWVHQFHVARRLDVKAKLLLESCPTRDAGTLAIEQFLSHASKERAAAFALATFPAAVAGKLPIGAEAVSDLGRAASGLLTVDGEMSWREHVSKPETAHPDMAAIAKVLGVLEGARHERARQLLYWCLLNQCVPRKPAVYEAEFNACVSVVAEHAT
jgi:MoxR-like ATPase